MEQREVGTNIEAFHPVVGFDARGHFEQQVAYATSELASALQSRLLDKDTTVNYATHVFAKMLDDLAEMLELPKLLN